MLKKLFILFWVTVVFTGWMAGCGNPPDPSTLKPGGLAVGDKAADFSVMDSTGHFMKLSDVQEGWWLVLILYRGHWCSACQNQLLNLKQDYPRFQQIRVTLAAVSVDPVEDAAHMNEQWRFPFPLLCDTQFHIIDAYGARHEKGHDEKDISRPAVIIIDPQKIIRYKYVGKSPVDRPEDDEILFRIQQFQQQPAKN